MAADPGQRVEEVAEPQPAGAAAARQNWLRRRFRHPWLYEVTLFAIGLVVYQVSRALVIGQPYQAFQHAWDLIRWEQGSGLFVEVGVQQFFLGHIRLVEILNWFYMSAHWIVTTLFFILLYRYRPRRYPFIRNAFFAANAIALVVFVVFPVAPPRLMTGPGFVDTLNRISDINLHGGVLSGLFNPYAAVPSMHFGYAFLVGVVGAVLFRRWPLRLLALAYPPIVFITIVGTGNHYVLDSISGAVAIAAGFAVVGAWVWLRRADARPALRRILGAR